MATPKMYTDSFTGDASGANDPIVVPAQAAGTKKLIVTPPSGHAWTLYLGGSATGAPKSVDEKATIDPPGLPYFSPGDTVAEVSLDTGSGTFYREWL